MSEHNLERMKTFKKILKKKFGEYIAKQFINTSRPEEIEKILDFGDLNGLNMEEIVLVAVNYFKPPRITISANLMGAFRKENDVIEAILDVVNRIRKEVGIEVDEAIVMSIFPPMHNRLLFKENDVTHVCDDYDGEHEHEDENSLPLVNLVDNQNDSWNKFKQAYENS